MKKIVLLFVTATTMFACAPTEVKTDSAAATGTVTSTGPDVDMLKRGTTAFANGDWATVASNYADTAKSYHNIWPSNTDTTVGVKIPVIIEVFKKQAQITELAENQYYAALAFLKLKKLLKRLIKLKQLF